MDLTGRAVRRWRDEGIREGQGQGEESWGENEGSEEGDEREREYPCKFIMIRRMAERVRAEKG